MPASSSTADLAAADNRGGKKAVREPKAESRSLTYWTDILLVATLLAAAIATAWMAAGPYLYATGVSVAMIASVVMIVPLLFRRRWPVPVFLFIAGMTIGSLILGHVVLLASVAVLFAFYEVALRSSRWIALAAAVVLELVFVSAIDREVFFNIEFAQVGFIMANLVAIGIYLAATNAKTRKLYTAALEARAAALAAERDQQAEVVAAAERERIAREMHDIVAHNLAVMISLADGAAVTVKRDPDRAVEAMRNSASTGRVAMREMRRLLGVLRDDNADIDFAPQPGIADLQPLADRVTVAGLPASLVVRGNTEDVSQGAQLVLYRIVQEALTNSLRYAGPGAEAHIQVSVRDEILEFEVVDNGSGSGHSLPTGTGRGLTGMRDRASLYQGSLMAGPSPESARGTGWKVSGSLHTHEPAAA